MCMYMFVCLFGVMCQAGPGVQISLFHLSELFPSQKSTVLSIVTGAFQLGFVVFLCFRLVGEWLSIGVSKLCLLYCLPLSVVLLVGILVWPSQPLQSPLDDDPVGFSTSQSHSRRQSYSV